MRNAAVVSQHSTLSLSQKRFVVIVVILGCARNLMASRLLSQLRSRPRTKLALQLTAAALVPVVPVLVWSRHAKREREERQQEVATRVR